MTHSTDFHYKVSSSPRLKEGDTFLELSYAELEDRNLMIKKERAGGKPASYFEEKHIKELEQEAGIKAVTVCFSDMEGKFHMLDYNKKYLLESHDNITFDGSSIRGFTPQNSSDLRLKVDWSSMRWLPADVFGHGKVLVFANVHDKDGSPYKGDYRSNLMLFAQELYEKEGITIHMAPEIEGFLLAEESAEQNFDEKKGFELVSLGGYFNSLPQDTLRQFIDRLAEATRAMAFENEKDHPEVAPSQFEMNYRYTDVLQAADQIQLYKLIARQIAKNFGATASFLPKPTTKINGSGMHSNMSLNRNGKNLFYNQKGKDGLSVEAHRFLTGILYYANDLCLTINSSVNAYRRLDPHFEAPNEIKMSANDRGSMIRVPLANEKSARIEVRSVAPDSNPYLAYYFLIQAGLKGMKATEAEWQEYAKLYSRPIKKLPGHIYEAMGAFRRSDFAKKIMGEENHGKFLALKESTAHRCPRELGVRVKSGEVWYHHEVTNQVLWNQF